MLGSMFSRTKNPAALAAVSRSPVVRFRAIFTASTTVEMALST
jgi:hypothetical protein